ncbi:hypothetical protein D3C87_1557680 [compost metagenome]
MVARQSVPMVDIPAICPQIAIPPMSGRWIAPWPSTSLIANITDAYICSGSCSNTWRDGFNNCVGRLAAPRLRPFSSRTTTRVLEVPMSTPTSNARLFKGGTRTEKRWLSWATEYCSRRRSVRQHHH